MREFLINVEYGGFRMSDDFVEKLVENFTDDEKSRYGVDSYDIAHSIERDNVKLIETYKECKDNNINTDT